MDDDTAVRLIHTTDNDPYTGLTTPRVLESWNYLLRVARLRQHQHLLKVAVIVKDGQPQVHYHIKRRKLL